MALHLVSNAVPLTVCITSFAFRHGGWYTVKVRPEDTAHVAHAFYEHPTCGDEVPLLFWDGTEMWQTSEWDACTTEELAQQMGVEV